MFALKKQFSFIGKARFRRATLSCDSSYYYCCFTSVFGSGAVAKQFTSGSGTSVYKWYGINAMANHASLYMKSTLLSQFTYRTNAVVYHSNLDLMQWIIKPVCTKEPTQWLFTDCAQCFSCQETPGTSGVVSHARIHREAVEWLVMPGYICNGRSV